MILLLAGIAFFLFVLWIMGNDKNGKKRLDKIPSPKSDWDVM